MILHTLSGWPLWHYTYYTVLIMLECMQTVSVWNVFAVEDPEWLALVSNLSKCSDTVKLYIMVQFSSMCVCVKWFRASPESRSEKWRVRILSHYTQSGCITKPDRLLRQQSSGTPWQSLHTETPLIGIKINTVMRWRLLFEDVNNPCYIMETCTQTGRVRLYVAQMKEGLDL